MKLSKSNKISDCQKRFIERVQKKEVPSLKEWIAKQEKLYSEIKKKIDVSNFEEEMQRSIREVQALRQQKSY